MHKADKLVLEVGLCAALCRRGYDLDVSLFERLARSGFPVARLSQQRRMRTAIADLIRRPIYPSLSDHPLVQVSTAHVAWEDGRAGR